MARLKRRCGAAAVEFALVAPLLLMVSLGMVEFGRMLMVEQVLTNGAREGARKAVLPGATDADAYQTIDSYMSNCGVKGHSREVSPSPATADPGTPIRVIVSVPYNDVTWLPVGSLGWLKGANLSATAEMRKEEY